MKDPGNIILAIVALLVSSVFMLGLTPVMGPARDPYVSTSLQRKISRAVATGKPVLLEFSATWCGPCRSVKPLVHQFADENVSRATVICIDVDAEPDLSHQYNVSSIPCFVALKQGKENGRAVGVIPKAEMRRLLGL
jgi:thioredoxin 1